MASSVDAMVSGCRIRVAGGSDMPCIAPQDMSELPLEERINATTAAGEFQDALALCERLELEVRSSHAFSFVVVLTH